MDSILTSVKKMLGITEQYEYFDADIIMHINSVFSILQQLGVGDRRGFFIMDKSAVWTDFIISEDPRLNMVKSYMGAKVRSLFDPPQSGALSESLKNTIAELEWRLNVQVDPADADNTGFDIVTASDSEIAAMIDSLDDLGGRRRDEPDATDEEIEEIIESLDDLTPLDPMPPYEDDNTVTDEEINALINGLDDLGESGGYVYEEDITATQEEIDDLINNLDGLEGHEPDETNSNDEENELPVEQVEDSGDDEDEDDSEEDLTATQEDIDDIIGSLEAL